MMMRTPPHHYLNHDGSSHDHTASRRRRRPSSSSYHYKFTEQTPFMNTTYTGAATSRPCRHHHPSASTTNTTTAMTSVTETVTDILQPPTTNQRHRRQPLSPSSSHHHHLQPNLIPSPPHLPSSITPHLRLALLPLLLLLFLSPVSASYTSYLHSPVHIACRTCLPSAPTRRTCRIIFDGLLSPGFNGWIRSAASTRRVLTSYNRLFAGRAGANRLRCVRRLLMKKQPNRCEPTGGRTASVMPTPSESPENVAGPGFPRQGESEMPLPSVYASPSPPMSMQPSPSSSSLPPPPPSPSSPPTSSPRPPQPPMAASTVYSTTHPPSQNADILRHDMFKILSTSTSSLRNDPGLRVTVQLVRTDLAGFPLAFYPAYIWKSPSSSYPPIVLPSPGADEAYDGMFLTETLTSRVTTRVKRCGRANCAAMINIFSRKYLRRQAVRNAIKRVRRRPQFADVFDVGSPKFQMVRRGKRWFSVFVPFSEIYLGEF